MATIVHTFWFTAKQARFSCNDQALQAKGENPLIRMTLVFTKTAGRHNLVEVIVVQGLPLSVQGIYFLC